MDKAMLGMSLRDKAIYDKIRREIQVTYIVQRAADDVVARQSPSKWTKNVYSQRE